MVVHSAGVQDRDGAELVAQEMATKAPTVKLVWGDMGYRGRGKRNLEHHGVRVSIVSRANERERGQWRTAQMPLFTAPKGFILVKRRWVVERSFAWLGRFRRLSKDYEGTLRSAIAWLYAAFTRILAQRLAFTE